MSGQPPPEFSVVVLFGRNQLEPCLSSLLAQKDADFEIIGVVASEGLKALDPRVKFLVVPDPNPAKRRNLAVAQSRGKYLAFIDDDAIAPEDWLARAKIYFEQNPEIAGFGGSNLGPENMTWREQLTDMLLIDKYFGSGTAAYGNFGEPRMARPGEVHLSNFFLRREIFEVAKGFNEKIGYGGEDSEMVYWVKKKTDRDFWFFPELAVIHQRRPFGWELLKRNFRFRRHNGRMIRLQPDMYEWNVSLWAGPGFIVAFFIFLVFLHHHQTLFYLADFICCYYFWFFFFSLIRTLRKKKYLAFIVPGIYFLHHLSYLLGLSAGTAEGLMMGREKLQQLLGRENLD